MKTKNTDEIIDYISKSECLVLKIGMGVKNKSKWCPSFKAQNSHDPELISDSVCETFADVDCHFRNLNSVKEAGGDGYSQWHIYIGTTKSIDSSNITPEFVEKLSHTMVKKWADKWQQEKRDREDYEIEHRYGSDCAFGHLAPRPYDMTKRIHERKTIQVLDQIRDDLSEDDLGMP